MPANLNSPSHAPGHTEHGSVKTYILGLVLSVVLTMGSYFFVSESWLSGKVLIATITALGIAQALIQLVLFLHLGKEEKPRLNLAVFLFMALVLVIIVLGSLWIMENLNYRVMPTME
jgi:cytochrome o ubiquinol oxidase operon protein cyoD